MNNITKKLAVAIISLIIAFTTVACGSTKQGAVEPSKDPTELVQDENYTEQLKKEDIVADGQVYLQDGSVMGVMIIKEEADKEEAKKLIEEYAKDLRKTYKNMPVSVQAAQGGENIGIVTLD